MCTRGHRREVVVLPFHPRTVVNRHIAETGFEQRQIRAGGRDAATARHDRTFGTIESEVLDQFVEPRRLRNESAARIFEQQRGREPARVRQVAVAHGVGSVALGFQQLCIAAAFGHG
jgi:hypothetical protein